MYILYFTMTEEKLIKMKRDCRVVIERNFLRSSYPLSYKLLVCYDLSEYIKHNSSIDQNKIIFLLDQLSKSVNTNTTFYESHFIEVLAASSTKGKALIIIDRNDACYPLVLYPEDDNPDHGDRINAFKNALNAIIGKINDVYPILVRAANNEWTQDIQEEILKIIPDPAYGPRSRPS